MNEFRERFAQGRTLLVEGARRAGDTGAAQRATESYRNLRAMFDGQDDKAVSVERFLLTLVRAVRDDERNEGRSSRDVYLEAKNRRRKLALIALGTGPFARLTNQIADLYCETATMCDVADLHGLNLSDEQISAHMLELWDVTDSLDQAERAMKGDPPVATILAVKLRDRAGEQLPEPLDKPAVVKALSDVRGVVSDVTSVASGGAVRTFVFSGRRTKKVIKRAEHQFGVR